MVRLFLIATAFLNQITGDNNNNNNNNNNNYLFILSFVFTTLWVVYSDCDAFIVFTL